jgi:hypothetical protein
MPFRCRYAPSDPSVDIRVGNYNVTATVNSSAASGEPGLDLNLISTDYYALAFVRTVRGDNCA